MGVQREKEKDTLAFRNVKGYQREHRGKKRVIRVNECNCGESEWRALMVMWGQ